MRIYTDPTGHLYVNSISKLANGADVEGCLYFTQAGIHNGNIQFQRGKVEEYGVNGIDGETLLSILVHRTMLLPIKDNSKADGALVNHLQSAMKLMRAPREA